MKYFTSPTNKFSGQAYPAVVDCDLSPFDYVNMARLVIRSAKRTIKARPPPTFIPPTRLTTGEATTATSPQGQIEPKKPKEKFLPRGRKLPPGPRAPPKPNFATEVNEKIQDALLDGGPHFRVGGKEIYFPTAKVVLLRPNAKHTPYQAKFVVPRYFNKLDLRDYLYHVYGLRALNVTTQLLWARWTRETPRSPRTREAQIKKMTIEMEEPFVWPAELTAEEKNEMLNIGFADEMKKYNDDSQRLGSDKFKEPTSFGGLVGPFPPEPQPFIPKHFKISALKKKEADEKEAQRQTDEELVRKFLRL